MGGDVIHSGRQPDRAEPQRHADEEETRSSAREPVQPDRRFDDVLALQRTAGNHAVAGMLARQRTQTPVDVSSAQAKFDVVVARGRVGPKVKRHTEQGAPFSVMLDDTLVIKIVVSGVKNPKDAGVQFKHLLGSGLESGVKEEWERDNVYRLVLQAGKVGTHGLMIAGQGPDGVLIPGLMLLNTVNVLTDISDFEAACNAAHVRINERFARAISKLNAAAKAYEQAYALMEGGLKEARRREQLRAEMIAGLIYAGLGGLAGGATGAIAKARLGKSYGDAFVKTNWGEGLTDTAKDTVKFAVRTSRRLPDLGQSQGTAPSEAAGDPQGAPAPVPAGAQLDEQRPLTMLTAMASKLGAEQADALGHLHRLMSQLRLAKRRDPNMTFDEDPTQYAERQDLITTIDQKTVTDWKVALEDFWGAWLEENVVRLNVYLDMAEIRRTSYWEDMSKYLEAEVGKAASMCGSNGDTWMNRYLDPVRRAKRAEMKKIDAEERKKHGDWMVDQGPIGAP